MALPLDSQKMQTSQSKKPVVDKVPLIEESKDSVISKFNDFKMRIDQIKLGISMSPSES